MSAEILLEEKEQFEPMRPPFPFFGGKSRVAHLVWERFGNVPNYIEPFAGSLSVLLARPYEPRIETVNDKDCYIANFFRALQNDPAGVAHHADQPVNECVPAGTMISTPSGNVPVERIEEGMVVWGFDGHSIVPTRVIATKQSYTRDPLIDVNGLRLTGNHPVWTWEHGYVEADMLTPGSTIGMFPAKMTDCPVHKTDLSMLGSTYENSQMGDIYADRSQDISGSLCRGDFSRQATLQRTHVSCNYRRQNSQGLLDTIACSCRSTPSLQGNGKWHWRGLARCRATLDSAVSRKPRSGKSHRWRGRHAGLYTDTKAAAEMVSLTKGQKISSRANSRDAWAKAHARSSGKNSSCGNGTNSFSESATANIRSAGRETLVHRASQPSIGGASRQGIKRRTQAKNRGINYKSEACYLHRNPECFCLSYRSGTGIQSVRAIDRSSDSQRVSLSRPSLPVYNFQTLTGNYFANGILVHNCDLHARHLWLVTTGAERVERLKTDPFYFDVQVAGMWVWGISCWIGAGWCGPHGQIKEGEMKHEMPHLTGSCGVQRRRPALTNAGMGVHKKKPHLGHRGKGIHSKLPNIDGRGGKGIHGKQATNLAEWFSVLASRLRYVRVCCGEWTRVLGPAVTTSNGMTGVFLDPPYAHDAGRDTNLYNSESATVSHAVREWALANGDNPKLRIALCGLEGEHEFPSKWEKVAWVSNGGYSNHGNGKNKQNRYRERIWFSPSCIKPELPLFAL